MTPLSIPIIMYLDPKVKVTYFKFPTANNQSHDISMSDAHHTMLEMREALEKYIRDFSDTFTTTTTTTTTTTMTMMMNDGKPWLIYGVGLGLLLLLLLMTAAALASAILLRRHQKSGFFSVRAQARKGGTRFSLYAGDYFDDVGNVYRLGHLERCLGNGDSSVDLPLDQIIKSTHSR